MLHKLLFSSMFILFISALIRPLETQAQNKNSLINKFCIASLRSQLNYKDKQKSIEISNFTCDCFFKKFKSGSSMRNSRVYCKNKAVEKYNL